MLSSGLFGCEPMTPESPSPSVHHAPKKTAVFNPTKKIALLEHAGNYPKALEEAKLLPTSSARSEWTEKVLRDWSLFDITKAGAMYKSGHKEDAALLVGQVLDRQPDLLKKPSSGLTPELWTNFLLSRINENQEFWVIQTIGENDLLDNAQREDLLFHSYLHLSERRVSEKKYHSSLIDIQRALKIHPADPVALAVMKSLQDLQKSWTDKGYLEFTRQHLRRALFYWQKVIDLDPKDQDVKKNILKTKDLLKKLELIEQESASPGNPSMQPVH